MADALKFSNVSFSYGNHTVLDSINLRVFEGDFLVAGNLLQREYPGNTVCVDRHAAAVDGDGFADYDAFGRHVRRISRYGESVVLRKSKSTARCRGIH